MDIYTRLPDGFKEKHCRLKCIQVLIQAFSAQPHMHLTVLRAMGSGAFFKQALAEQFDQILIFGAGFDTQSLRFQDVMENTGVYELDVPLTQQAKIGQYQKRHLAIPPSPVSLVPDPCTKRGRHERKKYQLA
jgi:O-methyltransferase involved in polyketide biosynthesis